MIGRNTPETIKIPQPSEVYDYLADNLAPEGTKPVMVWLDVETTGLVAADSDLLEIGILLTDALGNIIPRGWYQSLVVDMDRDIETVIGGCNEYVTEMHTKSGLFEDLRTAFAHQQTYDRLDFTTDTVEGEILDFLVHAGVLDTAGRPGQIILSGSSNSLDRDFVQVKMPDLGNFIHYRLIDTSGLREVWYLFSNSNSPQPKMTLEGVHRPLADLINSIELYKFLLRELPEAIQGVRA